MEEGEEDKESHEKSKRERETWSREKATGPGRDCVCVDECVKVLGGNSGSSQNGNVFYVTDVLPPGLLISP